MAGAVLRGPALPVLGMGMAHAPGLPLAERAGRRELGPWPSRQPFLGELAEGLDQARGEGEDRKNERKKEGNKEKKTNAFVHSCIHCVVVCRMCLRML